MDRIDRICMKLALGASVLIGASVAQATTVVSDTPYDIFTQYRSEGYADQLTDLLGKGSLTLTSIFNQEVWQQQYYDENRRFGDPVDGINAAVTGKGPTFTVLRALSTGTGADYIVGWYNPVNGVTNAGGNAGETSHDSFIFNLTTHRVLRPTAKVPYPEVSNINAGTDIYLGADGSGPGFGITYSESYGDSLASRGLLFDQGLNGGRGLEAYRFAYRSLGVYAIGVDSLAVPPAVTAAVPEPASWAMSLLGLAVIGVATRRRGSVRRQVVQVSHADD